MTDAEGYRISFQTKMALARDPRNFYGRRAARNAARYFLKLYLEAARKETLR